ncbi:hypothetical protein Cni_G19662 [Canna indica]|uniref:Uncharacterized protein n=1 Tax=Canna indica TaxID=4628 RepID=A0AAQ3QIU3_9LILI|nr:hypothetical protein Cni_G19662 [Canna indica]
MVTRCVRIEDDNNEDKAVAVIDSELEEEAEEKDREGKLQRDLVFPAEGPQLGANRFMSIQMVISDSATDDDDDGVLFLSIFST